MNFNKHFFMSIIDRFTPALKDGCKSAEHPNRIHFKVSDVPVLDEIPQVRDMSVSSDATVAPFADRLIHPDLFGLSPAVNDTKKLIQSTENLISKCEDETISKSFLKLYSCAADNEKNIHKESHRITSLMKAVEIIDNPEIKTQILKKIDFLTNCKPKKFQSFYPNIMNFLEKYADAANTLSGKYLNINNGTQKFYKWMDKNNIWFLDIVDGTKKSKDAYRRRLITTNSHDKKYEEYLKNFDEYTKKGLAKTFENNVRQDAMKKFFDKYIETRPEAVKTLYHQEYLKTLSPDIAKECAEIQKEYNTYVITSNHDTTLEDIKYLKEELRLWKKAGKNEVVMPKIVTINAFDEYMLKNKCAGYANHIDDTIFVRELLEFDGSANWEGSTLRHEMQHIQEQFAKRGKNSFDEWGDAISWKYNKIRYRKKWAKELENAGINIKSHRDYAFKDKSELRSVTAETDMKKLSPKYKYQMTKKFEMQPWIFNIGDNEVAERSKMKEMVKKIIDEAKQKD